jgi:transcription antitermination factor NusG
VDDEIISLIMSRQGEDGFVRIGEEFRPGDKVIITHGPLSNFMGVFEGRYTDEDRVSVLLTTVSYQSHVVIGKEMLRKAG